MAYIVHISMASCQGFKAAPADTPTAIIDVIAVCDCTKAFYHGFTTAPADTPVAIVDVVDIGLDIQRGSAVLAAARRWQRLCLHGGRLRRGQLPQRGSRPSV